MNDGKEILIEWLRGESRPTDQSESEYVNLLLKHADDISDRCGWGEIDTVANTAQAVQTRIVMSDKLYPPECKICGLPIYGKPKVIGTPPHMDLVHNFDCHVFKLRKVE